MIQPPFPQHLTHINVQNQIDRAEVREKSYALKGKVRTGILLGVGIAFLAGGIAMTVLGGGPRSVMQGLGIPIIPISIMGTTLSVAISRLYMLSIREKKTTAHELGCSQNLTPEARHYIFETYPEYFSSNELYTHYYQKLFKGELDLTESSKLMLQQFDLRIVQNAFNSAQIASDVKQSDNVRTQCPDIYNALVNKHEHSLTSLNVDFRNYKFANLNYPNVSHLNVQNYSHRDHAIWNIEGKFPQLTTLTVDFRPNLEIEEFREFIENMMRKPNIKTLVINLDNNDKLYTSNAEILLKKHNLEPKIDLIGQHGVTITITKNN